MYLMLSENGSNYVHDFENIHSLERLMLKLNPQYIGHLMQSQLIGKDPEIGKH